MLVLQEPLEIQALREHLELRVHKETLDSKETLDLQAIQDFRELQEELEQLVSPELPVYQVPLVLRVRQVHLEFKVIRESKD